MTTITINRGEATNIPFSISDANNGLLGKRVTWVIALYPFVGDITKLEPLLTKASAIGASSAQITLSTTLAGLLAGTVNLVPADYPALTSGKYYSTLWIDDGAGGDRCATPNGADILVIQFTVART